jgi:hypothetical protein
MTQEPLAQLSHLTAQYVASHTLIGKSDTFALFDLVKILTATAAEHRSPEYVAEVLATEIESKLRQYAEKESAA